MRVNIQIEDASAEVLSAILDALRDDSAVVTARSGPPKLGDVVLDIDPTSTPFFATPMPEGPRKRGRPRKNPEVIVVAPEPIVTDMGTVTPMTFPEAVAMAAAEVSEPEVEAAPEVAEAPTLFTAMESYVNTFSLAAARAVLAREGVAKFSEVPEAKHAGLIAEMLAAVAAGTPLA